MQQAGVKTQIFVTKRNVLSKRMCWIDLTSQSSANSTNTCSYIKCKKTFLL